MDSQKTTLQPAKSFQNPAFTPRIARLHAYLQDAMLRKQASWQPDGLALEPEMARLPLLLMARVLDTMPIEIADDELLVGKTARGGVLTRTALPEFALPSEKEQAAADQIGRELLDFFIDRTRRHARRYPQLVFPCAVGAFSWYASIGCEVGASADGRFAGEPITPNFSPSFGADLNGPTAAIKSYCSMPGAGLGGGAPLDLRFSAAHLRGEAGVDRLAALIRVFIALGGNMLTITVTDVEELKQAMREPANYRSLRVRMGGWTAYFVTLNEEQQRLHIAKVEHGL